MEKQEVATMSESSRLAWDTAVNKWMLGLHHWEEKLLQKVFMRWKEGASHGRGKRLWRSKALRRGLRALLSTTSSSRIKMIRPLSYYSSSGRSHQLVSSSSSKMMLHDPRPMTHPLQILALFRWIRLASFPRRYAWHLQDSHHHYASTGRAEGEQLDDMAADIKPAAKRNARGSHRQHSQLQQQYQHYHGQHHPDHDATEEEEEREDALVGTSSGDWEYFERRIRPYLIGRLMLPSLKVPFLLQAHAVVDVHLVSTFFNQWHRYASALSKGRDAFVHRRLTLAFHCLYRKVHRRRIVCDYQQQTCEDALSKGLRKWNQLARLWARLPRDRVLDRIAQKAFIRRHLKRWIKRGDLRRMKLDVEKMNRLRVMEDVIISWEELTKKRKVGWAMEQALTKASERCDKIWVLRLLLSNAVLTRAAVTMQRIVRGFLGRLAADQARRIHVNEKAIGHLASKYSAQRIERVVLRAWHNAMINQKISMRRLSDHVKMRRVMIEWKKRVRKIAAARRLASLCVDAECKVQVRLALRLWKDKSDVLRYLEKTEAAAALYAKDKELSKALEKWWRWLNVICEKKAKISRMRRWLVKRAMSEWRTRTKTLQAMAVAKAVGSMGRSEALLRLVLRRRKEGCRCQGRHHCKPMTRLEAANRLAREKIRRRWRSDLEAAGQMEQRLWRREAWAFHAWRSGVCIRAASREAMEIGAAHFARRRLRYFADACQAMKERLTKSESSLEQAQKHYKRHAKRKGLCRMRYLQNLKTGLRSLIHWTVRQYTRQKMLRWRRYSKQRRRLRTSEWTAVAQHNSWLAQQGLQCLWRKSSRMSRLSQLVNKGQKATLRRRFWTWRLRSIQLGRQRRVLSASKALFTSQAFAASFSKGTRIRTLRSSSRQMYSQGLLHPPNRERIPAAEFLVRRLSALDERQDAAGSPTSLVRRSDLPDPLLCRLGETWLLHRWLNIWYAKTSGKANVRKHVEMADRFHRHGLLGWAISTMYASSRKRRKEHESLEKATTYNRRQMLRWLEPVTKARIASAPYEVSASFSQSQAGGGVMGIMSGGDRSAFSPLLSKGSSKRAATIRLPGKQASVPSSMQRPERMVARRVFTALIANMWRGGAHKLWMKEGEDHWRKKRSISSFATLKSKALIKKANVMSQKYRTLRLRVHALAKWRKWSRSRASSRRAADEMVSRRQRSVVASMFEAWGQSARSSLRCLKYYHRVHEIGMRRVALDQWFRWASTTHLSRFMYREAVLYQNTKKGRKMLAKWRRLTSTWKSQKLSLMYAIAHVQGRNLGQAWLKWWRLARMRSNAKYASQYAGRYFRRKHLTEVVRHWRRQASFKSRFRTLSRDSLRRRMLLQWKSKASRSGELRAFSMALKCRQDVDLQCTAFHALSLWTSRQARLRQSFVVLAAKTENHLMSRMLDHWYCRVFKKQHVLNVGLHIAASHCHRLLRRALREWHALFVLQREERQRSIHQKRQSLWLWLLRTSAWNEIKSAYEKAELHHARRTRKRFLRKWKEVAFQSQLHQLQVEDGEYLYKRRLQRRYLRLWRGETELQSVIQEIRVNHGLRKGIKGLKDYVTRSKRRRLKKAFHAMRDVLKGTFRRSRRRIEIGLERALARFFLHICMNRWRDVVAMKMTHSTHSIGNDETTTSVLRDQSSAVPINPESFSFRHDHSPTTTKVAPTTTAGGGGSLTGLYFKTWKNTIQHNKRQRLEMMWKARAAGGGGEGKEEKK